MSGVEVRGTGQMLRGEKFKVYTDQVTEAADRKEFYSPDGALEAEKKRLKLAWQFRTEDDHRFSLVTAFARAALTFWLASEEARRLSREKGRRLQERLSWRLHATVIGHQAKLYHRRMNRAMRKRPDLPLDQRAICDRVRRRLCPKKK